VNIGDIAHTPGVLALLEKYLPAAEVRLWPSNVDNGVAEMLMTRFPKLQIARDASQVKLAFDECDFLLHGSGPSLVAEKDVARWLQETGKPYGVYGITLPTTGSASTKPTPEDAFARTIELLGRARFLFFRDSISLELAKQRGCPCPIMEFGPDGAFATDLRDEARAQAFLQSRGLEDGQFLCCLARLRYTPYWKIKKGSAFDPVKHARNEQMKEHDLAPIRQAIVEVVRQTRMKVLLCPEDASQMEVSREMLYDPLPEDAKARVVWRPDYWLTAEAVSTYARSAGIFGAEMHSPILGIGLGIPAIVCRWAEQTSKGMMWRDIGLGDWLFDLDRDQELARVVPTVLAMAHDPTGFREKAEKARQFVHQRQRETMSILQRELARVSPAK
jgi:polysaccharide pyruvyl transferase WcaK-like protein